jgi:hypothetical protein
MCEKLSSDKARTVPWQEGAATPTAALEFVEAGLPTSDYLIEAEIAARGDRTWANRYAPPGSRRKTTGRVQRHRVAVPQITFETNLASGPRIA